MRRRSDRACARLIGIALLVVLLGTMQGAIARLQDYPVASATNGCSQEDAPAIIVTLLSRRAVEYPQIVLELSGLEHHMTKRITLTLSPLRRDLSKPRDYLARAYRSRRSGHKEWLAGTVNITRFVDGRAIAGSYSVRGEDHALLSGTFSTAWQITRDGCG